MNGENLALNELLHISFTYSFDISNPKPEIALLMRVNPDGLE